jgi:hypothetical protein
MADHKPVPEDRKSGYIAPLIVAVVVIAILAVVMFRAPPTTPPDTSSPATVSLPSPKPVIAAVLPLPVLTRKDLVEGDRQLAAAFAATGKLPEGPDPMVGRHFSLRLAFGCNGLQGDSAAAQATVSYDANNQSVTLTAQPGVWTTLPLIQALPETDKIESVEGFWLPRPWVDVEGCPPQMSYPVPATPTPPTATTLGLAQIFAVGGSRVTEHADKPYSFTRKIPADGSAVLGHSYRLLLEGTITGFSAGHALRCWVEAPDHAPVCLYGVTFDHVAFEDGDTGEVLANWNN